MRAVVLIGAGHTHQHVLRQWRRQPPLDARLICVSDSLIATYSGMLPGTLAGQYAAPEMTIDLARLCAAPGIEFVQAQTTGLDLARRVVTFADHSPINFDVLSIGIGSIPSEKGVTFGSRSQWLTIKPMQTFLDRLRSRVEERIPQAPLRPLHVVVVGGGAAGVELALCLRPALRRFATDGRPIEISLVSDDAAPPRGALPRTSARVRQALHRHGIQLRTQARVSRVDGGAVTLSSGDVIMSDLVVWATEAAPPPLLSLLGLPTDARGFLSVQATLQTTAELPIFAVGDTGTITNKSHAKAGVTAVRQGPVLWENIERMLQGRPLKRFDRPRGFLKLLNTGDGRAIGEWRGASFEGAWCWWLKDRIDRRFVGRYRG